MSRGLLHPPTAAAATASSRSSPPASPRSPRPRTPPSSSSASSSTRRRSALTSSPVPDHHYHVGGAGGKQPRSSLFPSAPTAAGDGDTHTAAQQWGSALASVYARTGIADLDLFLQKLTNWCVPAWNLYCLIHSSLPSCSNPCTSSRTTAACWVSRWRA